MGGAAQYLQLLWREPRRQTHTFQNRALQLLNVTLESDRPGVESSCSKVLLDLAESASLSVKWV